MIDFADDISKLVRKVWPEGTVGETLRRRFLAERIREVILLSRHIDVLGSSAPKVGE